MSTTDAPEADAQQKKLAHLVLAGDEELPEGYVPTTLFEAMRDGKNRDTLRKLGIATLCMAIFPLAVFFYVRDAVLPDSGIEKKQHDLVSALCGVFTAQIVIGGYVIMAMNEGNSLEEDDEMREAYEKAKTNLEESKKDK